MTTITIYGASDDCICIQGDTSEEFYANGDGQGWLQLNCGAVIGICYDLDGRWRIGIDVPTPGVTIERFYRAPAEDPDDRDYTDRLTISGDLLPITFYDDVSNIDDLYRTEGLEWVATS